MPVASVFRPITPPSASISRTMWPLAKPADGRVAGHLADGVEVLGEHQVCATEPGGGHRGLDPGVAGTDHNHIVGLWDR